MQGETIDLIETIVMYKFPKLSLEEIRAMLDLNMLKESQAIQEAIKIGREEGREEGREAGREEGREAGREEGILQGKLEAVPVLLRQGLSVEAIASALSVSVERVRQRAGTEGSV